MPTVYKQSIVQNRNGTYNNDFISATKPEYEETEEEEDEDK